MGLKVKLLILGVLTAAAVTAGVYVARSIQPERTKIPEEVYAALVSRADSAEYYLGCSEGYVAVYKNKRLNTPLTVTVIELSGLRSADMAMLEKGIPVTNRQELLKLLEDLGS